MNQRKKTFLLWLFLVVLWNFGFPGAKPLYDVVVATVLSLLSTILNKKT